jgi:hypothetical protein
MFLRLEFDPEVKIPLTMGMEVTHEQSYRAAYMILRGLLTGGYVVLVGAKTQLDDSAGVGNQLCLPSVVGL